MTIHSKRAAVLTALLAISLAVRLTWGIGRTGSGVRLDASFGPAQALVAFVVPAVIIGVLVFWLSKRSSRRPTARR
jgi:ABC-type spermidine/putrescine transport system permease subunit II